MAFIVVIFVLDEVITMN